uniref:Uncharacterized protein n=1 Tax=Glossina palpalis gambiensis TaxID=67801 RepID=A0A1B0B1I0_9MUSC
MLGIQDSSQVLIAQTYKYFNRVSLKEVSLHEVIKAKNFGTKCKILTKILSQSCITLASVFRLISLYLYQQLQRPLNN